MFLVALVMFVLTSNLIRSRVGRGLIAMRDNETGAAVSGVYPAQYKVLAFATSALVTGSAAAASPSRPPPSAPTRSVCSARSSSSPAS